MPHHLYFPTTKQHALNPNPNPLTPQTDHNWPTPNPTLSLSLELRPTHPLSSQAIWDLLTSTKLFLLTHKPGHDRVPSVFWYPSPKTRDRPRLGVVQEIRGHQLTWADLADVVSGLQRFYLTEDRWEGMSFFHE
ncbi:hypothetical protein G7Y79_00032g066980 [Physcia stellaris]|nr:hypothetical protein G7Y79_00032g066980 [Physcia stellaris]